MIRVAGAAVPLLMLQCAVFALFGCDDTTTEGAAGAGGNRGVGGAGGDATGFAIVSTVPSDQESEVEPGVSPTATFNEAVAAGSLSETSFTVSEVDGGAVSGEVTLLDSETLGFQPDTSLALLSEFSVTLAGEVQAVSGSSLAEDVTWGFSTRDGVWRDPELAESIAGGSATAPVIAVAANGEALVVWIELTDSFENAWANHYDPDSGWGDATLLEVFDGGSAGELDVSIDAIGRGIAVWRQDDGAGTDIFASRYIDGVWDDPRTINEPAPQRVGAPRIDVLPDGGAVAAWLRSEPGAGNNIWANLYSPGLGWGEEVAIHRIFEDQTAFDPQVSVGANGDAVVVWSQVRSGSEAQVYANRYVPSTGWGFRSELISGAELVDSRRAKVAADAIGNAMVVWEREPSSAPPSIWASRFVVETGWEPPLPIAEDELDSVQVPQISMDGAGNAFAIWGQRKGQVRSIVVNRFDLESGWGTPEPLFELGQFESGFINDPNIAADSKGNALAVWVRNEEPRSEAYASRYVLGVGWSEPETLSEISTGETRSPTVGIDSLGRGLTTRSQSDGSRRNIWSGRFD